MAFPLPSHLPRKKDHDVSTMLLAKMSETPSKSLTFELASTWASELEDAIQQTKRSIHERIQKDLPEFEQQLSSAKSVQDRLQSLTHNVDNLSTALSDPETGIVPSLIMTLTQHATLSQEAADVDVNYSVVSHLARCRQELRILASLVQEGKLPAAVRACEGLEHILNHSPPPLMEAQIMNDLKRNFRALRDRTEEQLNEAYSRSIAISPSQFIIRPSVQVRQSGTILDLFSIISSLSPASLSAQMTALRRDINAHFVEYVLQQPASVAATSTRPSEDLPEHELVITPAPPNTDILSSRIENLSSVLTFMNTHLFPHLPPATGFPLSLSRPLTTALLNKLLIPSLPSTIDMLPKFLDLAKQAVEFEQTYIAGILGDASKERALESWAGAIGMHYERQRRIELLDRARSIIVKEDDEYSAFRAEVVAAQDKDSIPPTVSKHELSPAKEEAAWGFGDEEEDADENAEENGWGFDDDVKPAVAVPTSSSPGVLAKAGVPPSQQEQDSDNPWGWNDDDDSSPIADEDESTDTDFSAWDDPWGDNEPVASKSSSTVKTATQLEKMASSRPATGSPLQSPVPVAPPPPTPAMPFLAQQQQSVSHHPTHISAETESYLVSSRPKELLLLVQDILREAGELSSSGILSSYTASGSPIGNVISQTAALALDLYSALYPVTFVKKLEASSKQMMCFSNDCLWLSEELRRTTLGRGMAAPAIEKLEECRERLEVLGDSWFLDSIESQIQRVNKVLDSAEGFDGTADQDRFDECENAVNQVLQEIRRLARQLKPIVTKSKYYEVIGSAVDAALSRVLKDVLALSDIPEVESHKLSELCRILNALEGLFVENSEYPSFIVSYVPSWLKFSYLSELLEASIADISYLFQEGDLVDFEIEELVKLVRALFADTPLRANTITKLMHGHPVRS